MATPPDRTWTSALDEPSEDRAPGRATDRYLDRGELGRGGLGRVVAAHDEVLDRVVARKELIRDSVSHRERFQREARITAGLEHPAIVPIYDAGALPDGTPYYTMKRVDGRSLAEALADAPTLPERLGLLDAVLRVCQAVAYAHARGVVHRDLKPDNVMLGRFGETWVVDWGLARRLDDPTPDDPTTDDGGPDAQSGQRTLTRVGAVVGTPGWMSPEQASAGAVSPASDVWSLGAILYAVLTGRSPIDSPTPLEAVARAREGPVTPVGLALEGVPPDLAAVVDKALAFRPSDRYPDAGALADELQAWMSGQRVRAYAYSPWQVLRRELWRRRAPVGLAILGLATLTAAAFEADRRERLGDARALAAERRERAATAQALAGSLASQGAQALLDRDPELAGALGAVALRYADLPEARGLVARALVAGGPRRVEALEAGFPCRWLEAAPDDAVVCGGNEGLVVWADGAVRWSGPPAPAGALVADRDQVVVAEAEGGGYRLRTRGLRDGAVSWEGPALPGPPQGVAWSGGRAVWTELGVVHGADGARQSVCASQVSELRVLGEELHTLCVNGMWNVLDARTLAPLSPATFEPSVSFAVAPEPDGAWFGVNRSVVRQDLQRRPIARHETVGYPSRIARSGDGRWLVVATERGHAAWIDLSGEGLEFRIPVVSRRSGLAFRPDGTLWASAPGGAARWSPPRPARTDHPGGVADLVAQPDGSLLVSSFDGSLARLDLLTGERRDLLSQRPPYRPHLFPVGDRVVVGRLQRPHLELAWVGPDGVGPWSGIPSSAHWIGSFGQRLAFDLDGDTLLLDRDLQVVERRPGVLRLAGDQPFERDGGRLTLLDPTTLAPVREIVLRIEVPGLDAAAAWSWVVTTDADSWWIFLGPSHGLASLDLRSGVVRPFWPEWTVGAATFQRLSDGRWLVGSWDGTWRLLDERGLRAVLHDGEARASLARELPGDRLATLDWDGRVVTWDLSGMEEPADALSRRALEALGASWVDGRLVRH